jgi:putative ABC transport system substrate-binding protein
MRRYDAPWAKCVLHRVVIAVALLSLALPAAAQDKVWRVGLLNGGGGTQLPGAQLSWRAGVLLGLARNGYSIGSNLEVVDRHAAGDADRLPSLAREIAAAKVDVVVAIGDASVRAMLAATSATPIVMVVGVDPVALGFVVSLARPGGMVTGLAFQTFEGDVKRLQFLHDAMPDARRFGYLRPPGPSPARAAELLEGAARRLNIEVTTRSVDRLDQAAYEAVFAAMRGEGVVGVLIASTQALSSEAQQFGPIAQSFGLPTICEWEYMARTGCVLAYGHDLAASQRRVGEYAARILKGSVPADLPVEQPDAWKLTVNLGAAARVGVALPPSILARADEVIE